MKKLLFSIIAILFAFVGNAQNACNATFTWSQTPTNFYPYQVTAVNASSFTGAPANSYATYTMSWGDGTSSTLYGNTASVTHNYSNASTYTAVLTMNVYDSINQVLYCNDTFSTTITTIVAPCNTVINTTNNGSGSYTFTASNQGGSGLTYLWNFGDGTSAGNLSAVTHTYTNAGTYTVVLTISVNGLTCTSTTTVNFTNGGSVNCNLLSAHFTHSASGLTTFFNNTSTNSGNTNPLLINSSHWNFGDNTTSTSNFPTHTYASSGYYLVTLVNNWVDSTTGSNIYCTKTDTQTIYVANNAPNYITGGIYWDSTLNITASSFKVWLITFDTATNIISAIDSVTTSGIQGQVAYTFNNVPAGVYRTKAAVVNGVAGATSMAPTYSYMSTYWGTANVINHNGGSTSYKDIYMQAGTSTNGPGFIAGNVTQGAGKGTGTGVPNLLILLRNASNQMVKFTYTDANGDYSFSNLALGTYNIYPENMPQITTPSSSISITNSTTSVSAVDFVKNSVKIIPKNLGVNDVTAARFFVIHPNPAKDVVTLNWNSNVSGNATITLVDISGKLLMQTVAATNNATTINIGQIPSGVYFLKIVSGSSQQTEKLVIQK